MKPLCLLLLAATCTLSAQSPSAHGSANHWVASWASSMMAPDPQNNQPALDPTLLTDATIREVVHLSLGGPQIRVHLSNATGNQPLTVDSVFVARPVSGRLGVIDPKSQHAVLFAGQSNVTIPSGADLLSDPIPFDVPALSDLAISFHLTSPPHLETTHAGARATTLLVRGEHGNAPNFDTLAPVREEHWYQLSAVDVAASPSAGTIVAFGDSITDGRGSTTDGNTRWTDFLASRLQSDSRTRDRAVVNEGIGGNHLLTDGLGASALARMDRDVLAQDGVRAVILFEGINDIGSLARGQDAPPDQHAALVARMISAYRQIIWRAHAHGIKVMGATLTPFSGSDYYRPTSASEADRQAVNTWIRTPGHFDAVIDFDQFMRDARDPSTLQPASDSGDHLHPGSAGYKRMADLIPISLFY